MSTAAPVLVFRTVSVEKLDGVLAACRAHWPAAPLAVASSPNRRGELLADARVSEVVEVPVGPDGFPPRLSVAREFAAVVVPLGNARGSGYANVLAAARRCRAAALYVMPYAVTLRRVSRLAIAARTALEATLLGLSLPLAWLAARWIAPRA